jgi:hypothetical protein
MVDRARKYLPHALALLLLMFCHAASLCADTPADTVKMPPRIAIIRPIGKEEGALRR